MEITTAELHRKYFKELMEDGQPHKLNEICIYAAKRMEEDGIANRTCSSNRVQLSLMPLLRQADCGYMKPCFGFYQKATRERTTAQIPDMWSEILDETAALRDKVEMIFSKEIPLKNSSDMEIKNYKVVARRMLANADLMLDHYSAWLAMMDDHQNSMEQGMTMGMNIPTRRRAICISTLKT